MNITRPLLKKRPLTPKSQASMLTWAQLHPEISKHLDVVEQRFQSNILNAKLVYSEFNSTVGRKKAQDYNRRNCIAITEQTPKDWRDRGQAMGFPRRVTCSAKEVARRLAPELACARSLADDMVNDGIAEDVAFHVGKEFVQPFKLLLDSGWMPGKGQHAELTRT